MPFRIGKGSGKKRPAVCFHRRGAWARVGRARHPGLLRACGSCERTGTARASNWGSMLFPRRGCAAWWRRMDIVLLPQVNPDGRHFSMDRHPFWRKNRRPAPRGKDHRSIGVDFNRNFPVPLALRPALRPENGRELPQTRRLRDLRRSPRGLRARDAERDLAAGPLPQHPVLRGPAQLRRDHPAQLGERRQPVRRPADELPEPAYDGMRGRIHDQGYREYIPAADEEEAVRMGQTHGGGDRAGAREEVSGQAVGGPLSDRRRVGRLRLQSALRRAIQGQD